MTISKNKLSLFVLLFLTFAGIDNTFAMTARQARLQELAQKRIAEIEKRKKEEAAQAKEKRTQKQTWSKVVRLKWSELDKKDAWNIFLSTATVGSVVVVVI